MYIYQYILLAGLTCLLFNKNTRFSASVFLTGWLVYLILFIDAPSTYKYIACGVIEFSIAYALNKRHLVISFLGYFLILVNVYGLLLIKIKVGPLSYDIIYAIISITQFLFLLIRAMTNGITRLNNEHFIVFLANFDSRSAYDRMYKSNAEKG